MSDNAAKKAQCHFAGSGRIFSVEGDRTTVGPGSLRQFRRRDADCSIDCGLGAPQPPRQQRQRARIEAFAGEFRHHAAQPCAGEARISVRRVVGKPIPARSSVAMSRAFGSSSSGRTSMTALPEAARRGAADTRPCREPGEPLAAAHADQHGLGLVVERVRGEDMAGIRLAAAAASSR